VKTFVNTINTSCIFNTVDFNPLAHMLSLGGHHSCTAHTCLMDNEKIDFFHILLVT